MNDINNLKTNYEHINQTVKQDENNKLLNNIDKKSSVKTLNNKSIKKKPSMKNSLNNLMKILENKKNKNDLNIVRSEPNTLRIKKNKNQCIICNNSSNYFINTKYINSINNNIHNKIRTFLELKPIKTNKKIEKIERNQLSIEGNFINNLTINLDLLPQLKMDPIYQNASTFNTLKVDSKEKIKMNLKTSVRIKSSIDKIKLEKPMKKKINYKGSKVSLNNNKNYDIGCVAYYYNNIINNHKNSPFIRIKNSSANK